MDAEPTVTEKLQSYAKELGLRAICVIRDVGFTKLLPSLQSVGGIIIEKGVLSSLEAQGFSFDVFKHNRSESKPEALFDGLAKYWKKRSFNPNRQALKVASAMAFKVFGCQGQKLEPLPLDERLISTIKTGKSSGAPEFVKKGEAFLKDLTRAKRVLKERGRKPYCVPWRRTQPGKDGPKVRLVWGYPQAVTLMEARFARPLIDRFVSQPSVMAFGLSDAGLGARLIPISNMGSRLSLDFSGFDSSIHDELISIAFSVMATHFRELNEEERRCWQFIRGYFTNTPIAMPDGQLYVKRRGVPSGSYFTQIVDSIVNFLVVQYAFLQAHQITIHPSRSTNNRDG